MKKYLLFAVAFSLMLSASAIHANENPSLLHVYLMNKTDVMKLADMPLDIPYYTEDYVEVVAYSDDIAEIAAAGLHYDIVQEDMVSFYQQRNPVITTMGGYLTYSEVVDSLDMLHMLYPELVSEKFSIGQSWEERDLWVIKVSDNVDTDEDEPEIFYNALIHAREPASMAWQLNFLSWLLENYGIDDDATEILDGREIWFLPVFNPDGYEYNRQTNPNGGGMWRKNRRSGGGVDLNRNWGYMWGYDDDGSSPYSSDETYRGPAAFSEPETQAVRDFITGRDFSFIINAHTYGNWWLYPYGYDDIYTPDQSIFSAIGDSVETLTGGDYRPGTAWECLYNTNGDANDWQYGELGLFCATPETGNSSDGFWPASYRINPLNAQMLPVAIYIAQIAGNVETISAPTAPVLNPIGQLDTSSYTVSWTHEDEDNPAVAYELVEKSGYLRTEDDIESGDGLWEFDGYGISTSRYHSSNHSIFSGNENSYHGSAILADELNVLDDDTLSFWVWFDVEEDFDYGYVEISTDGGAIFTPIEGNITTNYDPNGSNRGNGITGSSAGWIEASFPLDAYAGMSVQIKFSYVTDSWMLESGIYIDDVYPIETFESEMVLASDIADNFYDITDRENGTYFYQVRAKDAEDQWSGFSNREAAIVDANVSIDDNNQIPAEFNLAQNYPNPFNASTEISFALSSAGYITLEVYDIAGRLVRTLLSSDMTAGDHTVIWNGSNDNAESVSSGIYFYKLTTDQKSETRRMTLLK